MIHVPDLRGEFVRVSDQAHPGAFSLPTRAFAIDGRSAVVAKKRPRPTTALPPGAKIETKLGSFEVTQRGYTGPILKAPVKKP